MRGYLETYRSVVTPQDCDALGHMSMQRYYAAITDGMFVMHRELGLGPETMPNGRRLALAVVRVESDFKAELVEGDAVRLMSGIEAIGGKSFTFRHRLIRLTDGAVAFETLFKAVLFDLAERRAATIPDALRERAAAFMV